MLRIQRDETKAPWVVLSLEGHIVGEWADLLEGECLELNGTDRHVVLDLAGVTFIGRVGVEVLGRLSQAGIGIIGCSPLIGDMLEHEGIEVARKQSK